MKWFNRWFISKERVAQVISDEIDDLEFTLLMAQNIDYTHVENIEEFHKQLLECPVRIDALNNVMEKLK